MPKLLFIDTSAAIATIAVSIDDELKAIRTHENANEQAKAINFMIAEVLQEAFLKMSDVDGICVCAGPGSYTGLRVGLSTAKGLAFAHDKPLLLFNRLDILSWNIKEDDKFLIALKARTNEYFIALFEKDGKSIEKPQHAFEQDLAKYAKEGFSFYTDDETLSILPSKAAMPLNTTIDIHSWIPKANERYLLKQFDDLAYSEPFYLKAAYTTAPKK